MCPDCSNIDPKDSRNGRYGGKAFYCKACKHYIFSPCKCDKYKKADKRKKEDIAKVKKGMSDYDSMGVLSGILIIIFFLLWALYNLIFG